MRSASRARPLEGASTGRLAALCRLLAVAFAVLTIVGRSAMPLPAASNGGAAIVRAHAHAHAVIGTLRAGERAEQSVSSDRCDLFTGLPPFAPEFAWELPPALLFAELAWTTDVAAPSFTPARIRAVARGPPTSLAS